MAFSQLFGSDEEQQNAFRRAQQDHFQQQLQQQQQQQQQQQRGNVNANLMQQLQQAQASLNQQLRDAAGVSTGNPSLIQAQLQQQLGSFAGGLSPNFGQLGGVNMSTGGFGNNLGGGGFANLSNLGSNLGQLGGGNHLGGGHSLLDMQRAENLFGAMSGNAGMQGIGQLSSLMQSGQNPLLQSRLNNGMFGANSQFSKDVLLNKCHHNKQTSLSANPAFPNSFNPLGQQIEQEIALGQHRRAIAKSSPPALKGRTSDRVHDFASTTEDHSIENRTQSRKAETKSRRKAKSFPVKLMTALIENSNDDAIAWLPDGKSFVIVNPDLFVDTVLRKTFKECKYASFVRKLHRWGFVRLTSGTGTDCFHHPLFQRTRVDICARIVCTPRDPLKATETEKRVAVATSMTNDKPPSLAGVEKFFRSRPLGSQSNDLAIVQEDNGIDLPEVGELDEVGPEPLVAVSATTTVIPTAEAAV